MAKRPWRKRRNDTPRRRMKSVRPFTFGVGEDRFNSLTTTEGALWRAYYGKRRGKWLPPITFVFD
jgi:hypothetical protein